MVRLTSCFRWSSRRCRETAAAAATATFVLLVAPPASPAPVVSGPPGLRCPSVAEVRRELEDSEALRGATVALAPAVDRGAALSRELELRDGSGQVLLRRRFGFQPGDCQAAARAVAVVVERYARDLQAPRPDLPPPAPAPAPAPVAQARSAPLPLARPTSQPPGEGSGRLLLLVGAVWNEAESGRVGGSLEVRARIYRFFEASAAVLAPATRREERVGQGGQARLESLPLRFRLLATTTGRLPISVGVDGLLAVEQGEASGIARATAHRRLVPHLGGSVAMAWPLPGRRFRVGADVGVYRSLRAAPFLIEGLGEVLAPPTWSAIAGLQIGWAVLP